jgi:hypothetical protein
VKEPKDCLGLGNASRTNLETYLEPFWLEP